MPTNAILIVIAAAIAVNLVIMAVLVGMFLVRRGERSATVGFDATRYWSVDPETDKAFGAQNVGSIPAEHPPGDPADRAALDEVHMVRPIPPGDAHQTAAGSAAEGAVEGDLLRDARTSLSGPLAWELQVHEEDARLIRYRRPVSVVVVEIDGLDRFVDRFGREAADRIVPPVGQTLHRQARATDHVARVGENRFAILLPETDESQVLHYVERIRTDCDRWLAAGAVATRLAIGWATPAPGSDLKSAVRSAEDRSNADRRRIEAMADLLTTAFDQSDAATTGGDTEELPEAIEIEPAEAVVPASPAAVVVSPVVPPTPEDSSRVPPPADLA